MNLQMTARLECQPRRRKQLLCQLPHVRVLQSAVKNRNRDSQHQWRDETRCLSLDRKTEKRYHPRAIENANACQFLEAPQQKPIRTWMRPRMSLSDSVLVERQRNLETILSLHESRLRKAVKAEYDAQQALFGLRVVRLQAVCNKVKVKADQCR